MPENPSAANAIQPVDRSVSPVRREVTPPEGDLLKAAFLARAAETISRLTDTVDDDELRVALEADTDPAILKSLGLARFRTTNGFAVAMDPLAAARARGEQAKRDLLAVQGDMLTARDVAARLGLDSETVEERCRQGLLIALTDEYGKRGFPSWQFQGDELLPGLEEIFRDFGVADPWSRAAFFFSGDIRLNWQTPYQVLLSGDIEAVRRAAAAYGEQVPA